MKKQMYVIKDELTGYDTNIMMLDNDAQATRTLKIGANDPNSMIYQSPEDYAIYRLGTYETETGAIITEPPVKICGARAVKGGK